MNTFSTELDRLIRKVPQEREAFKRFFDVLLADASSRPKYYTVNRLFEKLAPNSIYGLTQVLTVLMEAGFLQRIIRVHSPSTGDGIADFATIENIPKTIHDVYNDMDLDVTPENMDVLYRLPTKQETVEHKWTSWKSSNHFKRS